jgi:flagella basal body P-ring formation protein FlgA
MSCFASRGSANEKAVVVYAIEDILAGATIPANDVAEKAVDRSELPVGVSPWGAPCDGMNIYPISKNDVVGRISVGIHKGEILIFVQAIGFRGTTVVCARNKISTGTTIKERDLEESVYAPRDIPKSAVAFKSHCVGKVSTGIAKGQVLFLDDEKLRDGIGGVDPRPSK